jgi:hypothetical protein
MIHVACIFGTMRESEGGRASKLMLCKCQTFPCCRLFINSATVCSALFCINIHEMQFPVRHQWRWGCVCVFAFDKFVSENFSHIPFRISPQAVSHHVCHHKFSGEISLSDKQLTALEHYATLCNASTYSFVCDVNSITMTWARYDICDNKSAIASFPLRSTQFLHFNVCRKAFPLCALTTPSHSRLM